MRTIRISICKVLAWDGDDICTDNEYVYLGKQKSQSDESPLSCQRDDQRNSG